jgi:hypothetical protein
MYTIGSEYGLRRTYGDRCGDPNAPGDNLIDLPKGVLPAVDRAIALGYADPSRVGVWGASPKRD